MKPSKIRIAALAIILAILFFGLIQLLVTRTGTVFYLELIGLFLLLILTIIGFVGSSKSWGYVFLCMVFLFYILNILAIRVFLGKLYLTLLIISVVGFLLSIPPKSMPKPRPAKPTQTDQPHSMVFDENKPMAVQKVTTVYSPGKYVASSRSNQYHEPTCDWAKKIAKERRIWFDKKEDAWEKSYKAHSCVK